VRSLQHALVLRSIESGLHLMYTRDGLGQEELDDLGNEGGVAAAEVLEGSKRLGVEDDAASVLGTMGVGIGPTWIATGLHEVHLRNRVIGLVSGFPVGSR
jgi:hypothetical protein